MKKLLLALALVSGCAHAQTFKPLSQSSTFQALQTRVATIESGLISVSGTTIGHFQTDGLSMLRHVWVQDAVGHPFVLLSMGTSTLTGQLQFRDPSAIRATVGTVSATGPLQFGSDNGGGYTFNITGSTTAFSVLPSGSTFTGPLTAATQLAIGDGNFNAQIVSSAPRITFDTGGDYLGYDRSGNAFNLVVGNTAALVVSSTGVKATGSAIFNNDNNFNLNIVSGNPRLTVDTSSFIQYDRTNSNYTISTAAQSNLMSVAPSKVHIALAALPVYADNAAATTGGLAAGDLYRTSTGQLMVRY